jgi:hypothetical protein
MDFNRAYGTDLSCRSRPAAEAMGCYRASLRDTTLCIF